MFKVALGLALLPVLVGCRGQPEGTPSVSATERAAEIFKPPAAVFPPPPVHGPPEVVVDVDTLESEAFERAEPDRDALPPPRPINVAEATGAHPRTDRGDRQRFQVLMDRGDPLEVERTTTLVVRFDQPVVPLEAIGDDTPEGALLKTLPEIEGRGVWTAADTWTFIPHYPLSPGTLYHLTLPIIAGFQAPLERLDQAIATGVEGFGRQ
ncbi:MAG: hypothetical protein AAFS10_26280, partial [Myxococcota bacterium]